MSERRWIRVAPTDHIPTREGRVAVIGGREIAIFNLGDRWLAVDNRCPHKGGPLADGIVAGHAVVCPLHAWKIDLASGTVERPSDAGACIASYPVELADGMVLVGLPANARDHEAA
jgi:nitrite reductase (NADH) small subunit